MSSRSGARRWSTEHEGESEELLRDRLGSALEGHELDDLVAKYVSYLDHWAEANERSARWDRAIFWLQKIIVLAGAGGTSVFAVYQMSTLATAAALVSTVFTTIESTRPRGVLYKVHVRAANEIRLLQSTVLTRWDQIRLAHGPNEENARREKIAVLLDDILKRRRQVGEMLAGAEAALGGAASGMDRGTAR